MWTFHGCVGGRDTPLCVHSLLVARDGLPFRLVREEPHCMNEGRTFAQAKPVVHLCRLQKKKDKQRRKKEEMLENSKWPQDPCALSCNGIPHTGFFCSLQSFTRVFYLSLFFDSFIHSFIPYHNNKVPLLNGNANPSILRVPHIKLAFSTKNKPNLLILVKMPICTICKKIEKCEKRTLSLIFLINEVQANEIHSLGGGGGGFKLK